MQAGCWLRWILIFVVGFAPWTDAAAQPGGPVPVAPEREASRAEVVVLTDAKSAQMIGGRSEIFVESGASRIGGNVLQAPRGAFVPGRDRLNLGFSSGVVWLAFRVHNASSREDWLLSFDFPLIDRLQLFVRTDGDRLLLLQESGNFSPFQKRPFASRRFLLPLPLAPGTARDYYLAVISAETIQLKPEIIHQGEFFRRERLDRLLVGAYFGLLAAMLVYNTLLFIVLRDSSYVWYLVFLIASGLLISGQMGVAYEFLWPGWPWWAMRFNPFSTGLTVTAALFFLRRVLDLSEHSPMSWSLLTAGIWLGILHSAASLFLPFQWAAHCAVATSAFGTLVGMIALQRAVHHKVLGARPLSLAWIVYIAGGITYLLKTVGWLPNTTFTDWSLPLGSAFEMVVISIALGLRFSALRRDQTKARLRLEFIEQELQIARRLQESILPERVPDVRGVRCVTHYEPYIAVGGDFFDFAEYSTPRGLGVLIADAAGHGIASALMASMVKVAFTNQRTIGTEAGRLLGAINGTMFGQSDQSIVSAAYVYLDLSQGRAKYATGGHPLMIYCPADGEAREVDNHGPLLGWRANFEYPEVRFDLRPGDRLILYTDGLTEARNAAGELFEVGRLLAIVAEQSQTSAEALKLQILDAYRQWTAETGPSDDVALVIIDIV